MDEQKRKLYANVRVSFERVIDAQTKKYLKWSAASCVCVFLCVMTMSVKINATVTHKNAQTHIRKIVLRMRSGFDSLMR